MIADWKLDLIASAQSKPLVSQKARDNKSRPTNPLRHCPASDDCFPTEEHPKQVKDGYGQEDQADRQSVRFSTHVVPRGLSSKDKGAGASEVCLQCSPNPLLAPTIHNLIGPLLS